MCAILVVRVYLHLLMYSSLHKMGEIYTLRTKWVKMMPFNGWKNVNVQVNCLLARRTTSFANTKIFWTEVLTYWWIQTLEFMTSYSMLLYLNGRRYKYVLCTLQSRVFSGKTSLHCMSTWIKFQMCITILCKKFITATRLCFCNIQVSLMYIQKKL